MHLAAVEGDTATVCRLIEENHSPTVRETDGSTPVHAAAEHGQLGETGLNSLLICNKVLFGIPESYLLKILEWHNLLLSWW